MESTTESVSTQHAVRDRVAQWKKNGETVALVPTMGFLHNGHLSLVKHALELCDRVVVTIYVNPTQFGAGEDLETYPRDLKGDTEKLAGLGTDLIYFPTTEELYPRGAETVVEVTQLPTFLCGKSRPEHFRGVTTICAKLFHIVTPDVAVFGEKDFQQVQIIRKMVRDLCMNLTIDTVPTGREPDGLALSSRNTYLSTDERKRACILYRSLVRAQEAVRGGEKDATLLRNTLITSIETAGGIIDYVEIVNENTLENVGEIGSNSRAILAVQFGPARLIDNAPLHRVPTLEN